MTTTLLANAKAMCGKVRQTRKDEDGGMIIFSVFMFVLVLWAGGMAVDLMRFETTRAKLQGTLDRATLAAADLDQVLPADEVVRDYFEKAGMIEFLKGDPYVDEDINYRVVTAFAEAPMPLFFYDLPSVFTSPFSAEMSSLTVSGSSTAEERVTDVEVSLVLDVSGSMNRNNRIENLRPAARDFVTTVLANNTNAPEGLITISMVPYSAVVNPGTAIEPFLNINRSHMYSTCPMFDDAEFLTTELDLTETYDHVAHFDPDWYWDAGEFQPIEYPWCHSGDHNAILPVTTNEDALHTAINALVPYGNTAIDMGMKWGIGLIDDSTQTIVTGLAGIDGTSVPSIADGRPEAHGLSDVLKVIVLMTDGQNTQQYDLDDPFKRGLSPVWFDLGTDGAGIAVSSVDSLEDIDFDKTSVQYEGEDTATRDDDWFYWNGYPSSTRFQQYPNGFDDRDAYLDADLPVHSGVPGTGVSYESNVYNARWQELFATRAYDEINNYYFSRPYNHGAWTWDEFQQTESAINQSVANTTLANTRLSNLCTAARAEGIIIYTVAFEAPSGGQTALQDCASSPSHYFDVAGTDISDAFSAIASDIRALKLTQ